MSVPILRLQGTWLPALRVGVRLSGLLALINVATINTMRITFDHAKRQQALRERGLDFRQAKEVFDGPHLTRSDPMIERTTANRATSAPESCLSGSSSSFGRRAARRGESSP
jgi:hypothetical protein